jgi:septum formation protein
MKLILASSSPRRAEILRDAGIAFEVRVANINESCLSGESAENLVARLAEAKARAAAKQLSAGSQDAIVISADTAVELNGEIFGKPRDAAQAREMLTALSGRTHRVLTGIFLLRLADGASRAAVENTFVTMAAMKAEELERYIETGEPLDKAGAYAIQGLAGRYISGIQGCYFNVVGLPLARLCVLLGELGWMGNRESQ